MVSSSKLVIFGAAPLRLLHRILAAGALELVEHNLFRGEVQAVCEEQCIGQHIGQFVGDAVAVRVPVPLEAFEQFAGLDGDRLGQILGGMELSPITFGHECSQGLEGGLADHSGNLTGPYDSGCAAEVLRTVRMWSGPGDQAFSCCWVGWLTVAPALLAASPPAPCPRTSAPASPSRRRGARRRPPPPWCVYAPRRALHGSAAWWPLRRG